MACESVSPEDHASANVCLPCSLSVAVSASLVHLTYLLPQIIQLKMIDGNLFREPRITLHALHYLHLTSDLTKHVSAESASIPEMQQGQGRPTHWHLAGEQRLQHLVAALPILQPWQTFLEQT